VDSLVAAYELVRSAPYPPVPEPPRRIECFAGGLEAWAALGRPSPGGCARRRCRRPAGSAADACLRCPSGAPAGVGAGVAGVELRRRPIVQVGDPALTGCERSRPICLLHHACPGEGAWSVPPGAATPRPTAPVAVRNRPWTCARRTIPPICTPAGASGCYPCCMQNRHSGVFIGVPGLLGRAQFRCCFWPGKGGAAWVPGPSRL
jgi:hypothetical protein